MKLIQKTLVLFFFVIGAAHAMHADEKAGGLANKNSVKKETQEFLSTLTKSQFTKGLYSYGQRAENLKIAASFPNYENLSQTEQILFISQIVKKRKELLTSSE